jgi:hypothetical protein
MDGQIVVLNAQNKMIAFLFLTGALFSKAVALF